MQFIILLLYNLKYLNFCVKGVSHSTCNMMITQKKSSATFYMYNPKKTNKVECICFQVSSFQGLISRSSMKMKNPFFQNTSFLVATYISLVAFSYTRVSIKIWTNLYSNLNIISRPQLYYQEVLWEIWRYSNRRFWSLLDPIRPVHMGRFSQVFIVLQLCLIFFVVKTLQFCL